MSRSTVSGPLRKCLVSSHPCTLNWRSEDQHVDSSALGLKVSSQSVWGLGSGVETFLDRKLVCSTMLAVE